jgi:hypothetical protein
MARVIADWSELGGIIEGEITQEQEGSDGPSPTFYRYRRQTAERQRFRAGGAFFAVDGSDGVPDESGTFVVVLYTAKESSAFYKYKNKNGKKAIAELTVNVGASDGMPTRTAHAESINDSLIGLLTKQSELLAKPQEMAMALIERLDKSNQALQKQVDDRQPGALSEIMRQVGPTMFTDLFAMGKAALQLTGNLPSEQLKIIKDLKAKIEQLEAEINKKERGE